MGIVVLIVTTAFLAGDFLLSRPLEPALVSIPFRLDIELADHISLASEAQARFEFHLEAVENDSEMIVPMPETIIVSTANTTATTFEFGEVEFTAPGIFQYRVFQEISEDTNEESEIGAWLIDESIFHLSITISEYEEELDLDIQMTRTLDNQSEEVDELVFTNRYEVAFLGIWEYGHGLRLLEGDILSPIRGREQGLEFRENGLLIPLNNNGDFSWGRGYWELVGTDQLVIAEDENRSNFTFDVSDQSLTIIDEMGEVSVWFRAGIEHEDDRNWVITEYLDYFEIEAGYHIVRNVEISGDQFDFVVYDLEAIDANDEEWLRSWHFIIIVKRDGEVFDVMRHDIRDSSVTVNDVVIEVDLNFDGRNDILLSRGISMTTTCSRFRTYNAFLQMDDQLAYMPSFSTICSPYLDRENQRILAVQRVGETCSHVGNRMYELIDHEWVLFRELVFGNRIEDRRYVTERMMVNGQWQERELCYRRRHTGDRTELCEDNEHNALLYEQIFGEYSYWDFEWNHRIPAPWRKE